MFGYSVLPVCGVSPLNFLDPYQVLKNDIALKNLVVPKLCQSCADLGFSRWGGGGGGADFQKLLENFVDLFCSSKKTGQNKAVSEHFLKNFDPKIVYFRRALPFKLRIYWRIGVKSTLRKILG